MIATLRLLPCLHRCAQVLATYKRLGGPGAVDRHTAPLKQWLYDQASQLKHSNGKPLLQINSPRWGVRALALLIAMPAPLTMELLPPCTCSAQTPAQ